MHSLNSIYHISPDHVCLFASEGHLLCNNEIRIRNREYYHPEICETSSTKTYLYWRNFLCRKNVILCACLCEKGGLLTQTHKIQINNLLVTCISLYRGLHNSLITVSGPRIFVIMRNSQPHKFDKCVASQNVEKVTHSWYIYVSDYRT